MIRAAASRPTTMGLLNSGGGSAVSIAGSNYLDCWMCRRSLTGLDKKLFNKAYHHNACFRGYRLNNGLLLKSLSSETSLTPTPDGNGITPFRSSIGREFHTSSPSAINLFTPRDDTTLWGRILKKLGFTEIPRSLLKGTARLMYMKIVDELDYMPFFKTCNMPDTFSSWFIVVELHIWLLSARLMQDGYEGRIARSALVKAWFDDNDLKSKELEGALSSARKRDLKVLSEQFYASLISYDEGLLGDDYILAGALWKRFLHHPTDPATLLPEHFNSPESHRELADKVKALEMLVIYVRSQFVLLNTLSREQLLRKRAFKFTPFDDNLYKLVSKMEKTQIAGTSRNVARNA